MTAFRCLVLTADGRTNWRTIDAAASSAAVAQLVAEGATPLEVRSGERTVAERFSQPVHIGGKLNVGEQALVLSQLATLVRAGLPVDRSLDLIREQATRSGPRQLLTRAVAQLRGGASLASALDELTCFPNYVIGVLRSAERGGSLGAALASVSERVGMAAAARRQLVTALSYPLAVLFATVAALVLVLTEVVPQFAPIFEGEEAKLPLLTRMVLALSALVDRHWLLLAGGLAIAVAIPIVVWRNPPALLAQGRYRRLVPGLALRDQYLAGQLIGVLGTLIGNGVPVASALPLARGAVGSATWQRALGRVEQQVREGTRLSAALVGMDLIPSTAIRLTEVGERSGGLAEACAQASGVIAEAAKARLERIVALANPIAIMVLGGLVGSLVAGVMLGIFALGDFAG